MRSTFVHFENQTGHMAKALVVILAGSFACQGAFAGHQEVMGSGSSSSTIVQARVLSSTPVLAQVSVPQEVCYDELQSSEARTSGAGALLGAVAGAAVGNAVGKGSGRAVATGVGLIGGAILGNHIEGRGRPSETHAVRRCEQETRYENKVVGYNVTYEINGQRYSTRTVHEPGPTIAVQMTVAPVTHASSYRVSPVVVAPVVQHVRYVSPPVVVVKQHKPHPRHHHKHHVRNHGAYPVVYTYPQHRHGHHRWH